MKGWSTARCKEKGLKILGRGQGLVNQVKEFGVFNIGDKQPFKSLSQEGHDETCILGRSEKVDVGMD